MNLTRKNWIVLITISILIVILACCLLSITISRLASNGVTLFGEGERPTIDNIYAEGKTLLQTLFEKIELENIVSNNGVCGNDSELLILAVGIDQRGSDYLYGLADVIRIVRVDFKNPHMNVVALPRATLINVPPEINVDGPMLLNQSYFFGAPGMNHFDGPNYGAGSLQKTLDYNFGVSTERFLVIDFQAFVRFVDAIGGIEVDLPTFVDDRPSSYFEAGVQTLDGAQALTLARVRSKYSDLARIENQTIVIKAIFNRLKDPAIIIKLPQILSALEGSFKTDFSGSQITNLICLLPQLNSENIQFFNPTDQVITTGWEFIPNMNQEMEIFRWDQRLTDWIKESLNAQPVQE